MSSSRVATGAAARMAIARHQRCGGVSGGRRISSWTAASAVVPPAAAGADHPAPPPDVADAAMSSRGGEDEVKRHRGGVGTDGTGLQPRRHRGRSSRHNRGVMISSGKITTWTNNTSLPRWQREDGRVVRAPGVPRGTEIRRRSSVRAGRDAGASALTLCRTPLVNDGGGIPASLWLSRSRATCIVRRDKSTTFVSRHNTSLHVTPSDVTDFCSQHGVLCPSSAPELQVRITPTHVVLRECPFCLKPTRDRPDNLYKLYVQIGSGAYFCHRCGSSGSWYDFKRRLGGCGLDVVEAGVGGGAGGGGWVEASTMGGGGGGYSGWDGDGGQFSVMAEGGGGDVSRYAPTSREPQSSRGTTGQHHHQHHHQTRSLPMPNQRLAATYGSTLLDSPRGSDVLRYLREERGLTTNTLRKYGVGLAVYNFPCPKTNRYVRADCVTFPWIMRAGEVKEQEELKGNDGFTWTSRLDEEDDGDRRRGPSGVLEGGTDDDDSTGSVNADDGEGGDDDEEGESSRLHDEEEEARRASLMGPWMTRRIKARSVNEKSWQRLDPPGGGWGLFGWHTVPPDATELVLTEGEYDAMAVYQATGLPAVSLPNGCRSLPPEVLPLLERFDRIILWMDDDIPGREGAEIFARKIGLGRCHVVGFRGAPSLPGGGGGAVAGPKDANDALLLLSRTAKKKEEDEDGGVDHRGDDADADADTDNFAAREYMMSMIRSATTLPHKNIMDFADIRPTFTHEVLHPEEYAGVPMQSLPKLTGIIKGFRRGEVTVLTGPTGSGKTTFLGQLSVDLAEQGINTLWGSFEIKTTRLLHKLLQQFSREPLAEIAKAKHRRGDEGSEEALVALNAVMDRFEGLPLYFMNFHGGSDVDAVLDAMDFATYVHDVEHVILDNLQFMLTRNHHNHGRRSSNNHYDSMYDKFEMQDVALEKFRKFATDRNVHVTLVVHPRKEDEGSKLGISSVYGSAKATQEADTVLILQNEGGRAGKYLEVKKNRFDGTLGVCPLFFHHKSGRYTESLDHGTTRSTKRAQPKAQPGGNSGKYPEGVTAVQVGGGSGSDQSKDEMVLDDTYRFVPKSR